MKMKKITSILVISAILLLGMNVSADSIIIDSMDFEQGEVELTLEEAVDIMLENNADVINAQLNKEDADTQVDEIRKQTKELKEYSGNYMIEGSLANLQVVQLPELQMDFIEQNAERNYQVKIENLKSDLENAYYTLLHLQEAEEINNDNMKIAEKSYNDTMKKFELGLVAKQDVLSAELNYINAKKEYESSKDLVKKAKMQLNVLLGNDVMTEIKLLDKLEYKEYEVENLAEAISEALQNRNEIKAAEYAYSVEKINLDIVKLKYSENTFDYRKQKVKLEQAMEDLEETRRIIEVDVRSNYLDMEEKKREIQSMEKAVELASEVLSLTQNSYDVGMSTITELQTAQKGLKEAKLGLSQAILDYNLAVLKFEDSIGVGRTEI